VKAPRWYHKINPLWWFGNYDQPMPQSWDYAAHPHWQHWPKWCVWLMWRLRNPLHNFTTYVIGFKANRYALRERRRFRCGRFQFFLPFVQYGGRYIYWHIGWTKDGRFSPLTIRKARPRYME